jgi:ATP-dependent helicase/nuclease subunit A
MSANSNFPNVVIRASAGTGKTHQLTVRFIGLLLADVRPDEILATTFTRKAAGEILDRALLTLAQAAADESARTKLAKALEIKSLSADKCRELLAATVQRLHTLRIGTLDSYFLQIATSFGPELGLPPGWSICEEMADIVLRDEAIELVLASGRLTDLKALVHALTKGAAARSIGRLVRDAVSSLFELYRETEPGAWRRIAVCKGLEAEKIEETLAALATSAFEDKRMAGACAQDVERFRAADWEAFIATGLAAKVLSNQTAYYNKPLPRDLVALYERLLKHVESILVGQVAAQTEATHQLLERFSERYHALQLQERALRFSDVTFRLAAAAAAVGEEQLAFRLDGNIRHLLLDEFQDTSPVQWRVIRPLAESVTRKAGGSFFCVGDVKQAIYGWRGGVAEIFDALDGQLPGLTKDNLNDSYRSAQPVIDAVNTVFENLTKHPNLDKFTEPVRQWRKDYPHHHTTKRELAGHVTLSVAPAAGDGEDQLQTTFEYAAQRIRDCAIAAPGATIGVLVRTNTAVARLIYRLRSLGVAASEEGGNPLIDSPAVELILSLLKLADHPGDSVARFHLANSPLSGPLDLSDHGDDRRAAALAQRLRRQLLDNGYGQTVFHHAQLLAPNCDERDLARLQQLVELAYQYQPTSTLRTSDFLRLVETKRTPDPQSTAVRVMTIHQAKGLQFDVVFLPELEAKLVGQPDRFVAGRPSPSEPVNIVCRLANENVRQFFPAELQKLFEDDMRLEVAESLCVLYVAMTRAVHALHMIIAPPRPNEKSLPKTFAGLLRATLAADKKTEPGQTLYEHGDAQWHLSTPTRSVSEGNSQARSASEGSRAAGPPRRTTEPNPKSKIENPKSIVLAPSARRRPRGLERTSPSALEGGTRILASRILAGHSADALAIGTLFHAWLAQIEWLDGGLPTDDALRRVAARLRREIACSDEQIDEHLARFRKLLSAPTISDVLSRRVYESPSNLGFKVKTWPTGFKTTVYSERPFAIRTGDEILTGAIDRLVVITHDNRPIAADIIDFKTDDVSSSNKKVLAERVEFYKPQLAAYRQAAAQLLKLGVAAITSRLVFLQAAAVQAV